MSREKAFVVTLLLFVCAIVAVMVLQGMLRGYYCNYFLGLCY